MYYYAVIDANNIVTDIGMDEVEVNDPSWIPIESANYDLVGMWYDVEDQTFKLEGYKYLNKLTAVDGASSGLDADKLDGKEASEFALSTHNHDSEYADIDHGHTGYATSDHTHTGYAAVSHDHDEDYADIDHSHDVLSKNVIINKSNANVILKVSDLTKGTIPTTASYNGTAIQDASGNILGNMRYCQETDGDAFLQFRAFDYRGDGASAVDMRLYKTAAGQAYAQLPNLVRLASGNQAIYETSEYMIFGTGNKPTLIACKSDSPVTVNGTRMDVPSLVPRNANTHGLGLSGQRFTDCYLVNSPNVSSDRRLKDKIESVDADKMLEFVDKLNVVDYVFKDNPDVERIGLIAQEVEEAGGDKFVEIGDDGMYGLHGADLVYPLIAAVQALYSRVLELEAKLE